MATGSIGRMEVSANDGGPSSCYLVLDIHSRQISGDFFKGKYMAKYGWKLLGRTDQKRLRFFPSFPGLSYESSPGIWWKA